MTVIHMGYLANFVYVWATFSKWYVLSVGTEVPKCQNHKSCAFSGILQQNITNCACIYH